MKTRSFAGRCAAATILLSVSLTGCSALSGGSDKAVCDALASDRRVSATIFVPAVTGQSSVSMIQARIKLMDSIEQPPTGLEKEWKEWREYLDFAAENYESDPVAMLKKHREVRKAGEALSDFYSSKCF